MRQLLFSVAALILIATAQPADALFGCDVEAENSEVVCGDKIINQFPPELLEWITEAVEQKARLEEGERQELETRIDDLSGQLGFARKTVTSFFEVLGETDVPTENLQEKLTEIAEHYVELRDRADALVSDDAAVQDLIDQARAAISEGAYDRADELLIRAEGADIRAGEERFLNAAATRAIRGETSLTRLRYLDAAEHFAEAARLVPASEPTIKAGYFAQQGRALTRGNRTQAAIEAYERATELDSAEVWPWIHLGRLHQQAGDLSVAEQTFLKAEAVAEGGGDERNLAARAFPRQV